MKHRTHLICLIPAVVLAAWLIFGNAGSAALTGVGLVVLICPITMGVVMWMLMRQPGQGVTAHHTGEAHSHENVTSQP